MAGKQKHRGRPVAPSRPGEKTTLSIRLTAELKDRIVAAASSNGQPLSQEIEKRLEQSFEKGILFAEIEKTLGAGTAGLLFLAGRVMREAGFSVMYQKKELGGPAWMADPDAFNEAVIAAVRVLDEFRPQGELTTTPTKPSTGARYASDRIWAVVNERGPYPFGEKPWIDLARQLLGPDLLQQSRSMLAAAEEEKQIDAARREAKSPLSEQERR
jgi:hypothetical protein